MGSVTVTFRNSAKFKVATDALSGRIAEAAKRGVMDAAASIQHDAQARARHRSGRMADSVQTRGPLALPGGFAARVGVTASYGRRIELGYHGRDSIGRNYAIHGGAHAHPYLRPAAEQGAYRAAPIIRDRIREAM